MSMASMKPITKMGISLPRRLPVAKPQCLYCHCSPVKVKHVPVYDDAQELHNITAMRVEKRPVCGDCGFAYDGQPPFFLPVIGAPNAGKSTYVPMMVEQFALSLEHLPSHFNVRPINTAVRDGRGGFQKPISTEDLVDKRYLLYSLITNGAAPALPEKTASWEADAINRTPFLYKVRLNNGRLARMLQPREVTLTIRDCAGEEFLDEQLVKQLHRPYLDEAGGLVLCIDPNDLRRSIKSDAMKVVRNVISVMKPARRKHAPLSVIVTKFDRLIDEDPVFERYLHGPPLSADAPEQWRCIDSALRRWAGEVGGQALVTMLDREFRRVRWFPVSAIGPHHNITEDEPDPTKHRISKFEPMRVLDPIMHIYRSVGAL